MKHCDIRNPYRWHTVLQTLAILAFLAIPFSVRAGPMPLPANTTGACNIPETNTTDKWFNADDVIHSFAGYQCSLETLSQDTIFFRYYSFPSAPTINIGRYLTTDFFNLNSDVIVKLALYPFPPNPQFQNFAYYREEVLVKANTDIFVGLAGPQPPGNLGSCYAGGAAQYFYAGDNVSNNPSITFSGGVAITKDTRYPNQFGVGDPCNVYYVSEPDSLTLILLGIGNIGLLRLIGFRRRKTYV
jgi:hypothetical protein